MLAGRAGFVEEEETERECFDPPPKAEERLDDMLDEKLLRELKGGLLADAGFDTEAERTTREGSTERGRSCAHIRFGVAMDIVWKMGVDKEGGGEGGDVSGGLEGRRERVPKTYVVLLED